MKEVIVSIEELNSFVLNRDTYTGYRIKTNVKEIKLLITDYQSCCESYGYFSSNDDHQDFIGAELLSVETVDSIYKKESLPDDYTSEDDCIFVNLETPKGTLQFAVYNAHNGYYGHSVLIQIGDKVEETGI